MKDKQLRNFLGFHMINRGGFFEQAISTRLEDLNNRLGEYARDTNREIGKLHEFLGIVNSVPQNPKLVKRPKARKSR